jgi:predicted DNA-binding WGR domain protein
MSDWTVHLAFEEGNSSKFWRARVEGKTLYVNYGKIGSNGQTQVKELASPAAAAAEYEKLIREKRKKGYEDADATADGADGAAEAGEAAGDEADGGDDEGDEDGDDDERPARKPSKAAPAAAKPAPTAAKPAPAAARPGTPGQRFVLDAGSRTVETTLYLDAKSVRMESVETYASPEAAQKALERLKKMLGGEGYKPG